MPQKRGVVEDPKFTAEFKAISIKHPRAAEFLEGVRFILQRDPFAGYKWGDIWCLSSVGWASGLPLMTVCNTCTLNLLDAVLEPDGVCLITDPDRNPARVFRWKLAEAGYEVSPELVRAGEPGGERTKGTLYRINKTPG